MAFGLVFCKRMEEYAGVLQISIKMVSQRTELVVMNMYAKRNDNDVSTIGFLPSMRNWGRIGIAGKSARHVFLKT